MASVSRTSPVRRAAALTAALTGVALLGLAACGSDETTATTSAPTATPTTVAAGGITIDDQWARTSPMSAENGAAYATITCAADDALVGAAVDASVATTVELHETVASGDTGMNMGSGMDTTMPGGGQMTMQPVDRIECAAGTPVELKPGGYHVMLFGLVEPLEIGDTISLTLTFEQAGEVVVDVPVLDDAP